MRSIRGPTVGKIVERNKAGFDAPNRRESVRSPKTPEERPGRIFERFFDLCFEPPITSSPNFDSSVV